MLCSLIVYPLVRPVYQQVYLRSYDILFSRMDIEVYWAFKTFRYQMSKQILNNCRNKLSHADLEKYFLQKKTCFICSDRLYNRSIRVAQGCRSGDFNSNWNRNSSLGVITLLEDFNMAAYRKRVFSAMLALALIGVSILAFTSMPAGLPLGNSATPTPSQTQFC